MDSELTQKIQNCIKSYPKGVSDKDIQREVPEVNVKKRVQIINDLVKKGVVGIYKLAGGKIIYKINVVSDPENLKSADNEDILIYRIVKEAGNKGIWIRDIRTKSNLLPKQLDKVLRSLENNKSIKLVKPVNASKKKVYMLYNLEPDPSLTGGTWYSDQDFESDFVDTLNLHCYKYLQHQKDIGASITEVCDVINGTGISKIRLSEDDIQQILTTLIYDGKVVKKTAVGGGVVFKAIERLLPSPGFVRTPCGICPVFRNCEIACSVNPTACSYLAEWII